MENIIKEFKTPIYVRNAQKAYRERKKAQDPEGYNKRNCENMKKSRQKKKIDKLEQLAENTIINSIDNLILNN